MKIKSVTIMGITGGIGNALYEILRCSTIKIHGCYFSNEKIANELIQDKNVTLQKINLSLQNSVDDIQLPNNEAIVYLAGIPHFSDDILEFKTEELREQININLYSLLVCIKQALNKEKSYLKKIVIVSSLEGKKLKSIYHLFKFLQEKMIKKLKPAFSEKNISVSLIRTDWVNTSMYKQFIAINNNTEDGVSKNDSVILQPAYVAAICLKELNNFEPFREYDITNEIL